MTDFWNTPLKDVTLGQVALFFAAYYLFVLLGLLATAFTAWMKER